MNINAFIGISLAFVIIVFLFSIALIIYYSVKDKKFIEPIQINEKSYESTKKYPYASNKTKEFIMKPKTFRFPRKEKIDAKNINNDKSKTDKKKDPQVISLSAMKGNITKTRQKTSELSLYRAENNI